MMSAKKSKKKEKQLEQTKISTDLKLPKIKIIEKELTLDENYSTNIKNMLEQLKEEKYIHLARTFDFGGLIAKPFAEKKGYKSQTFFDKLDELDKKIADWFKEKEKNQLPILSLSLNNNQNQKLKLLINLENFYLLGFINNQNQYFHFDDEIMEKVKQKNKEEIIELETKIKEITNKNQLGKLNKNLKNLQGESLK